jgi:hypothetical protein
MATPHRDQCAPPRARAAIAIALRYTARVAGETVPCGNGITMQLHSALASVVHTIIPSMFKAQQPWAVMGSTASVLQGIPDYVPPDIDLVTTMEGAYIMSGAVGHAGTVIRQVGFSVSEPYSSHFGIFEVQGIKVEVMGDLIIRVADGVINATDHFARWSDKVRLLHFDSVHIPVVPLEWQLVANVLLDRPERSHGIADFLNEHGYDHRYLSALLEDTQLGPRTIERSKELVHLDG